MVHPLSIDEVTGHPRWGIVSGTKAEFVLGAAKGLVAGDLTIELFETSLVAAANELLRVRGKRRTVRSISQLQKEVSPTAAMWYHEIKRVSSAPGKLELLVKQGGHGLTKLYREIGPTQFHASHCGFGVAIPSKDREVRPERQSSRIQSVIEALMTALDKATPEEIAAHDADLKRAIAGLRQAQLEALAEQSGGATL